MDEEPAVGGLHRVVGGEADRVRGDGDWEAWLGFFLQGVKEVAEEAVATAMRIRGVFSADRARIEAMGRRASTVLRVHEALKVRPLESMPRLCTATKLSFPTVSSAMNALVEMGIARELTGKRRNRLFVYDGYLGILNQGAEPFR